MAENVNSKNATAADDAALGGAAGAGFPVDAASAAVSPAAKTSSPASSARADASPRGFAPSAGAPAPTPRTREEIAESLRVRTRRGTPTEKLEVIMTSAGLDRVEAATVMVIGLGGAVLPLGKLVTLSGTALSATVGIVLNLILPREKQTAEKSK